MLVRAIAVDVMMKILNGASSSDCLPPATALLSDVRDQAFLKSLVLNTCRWFFRLDFLVKKLLKQPLKNKDQDITVLLLLGLCQLMILETPPHAAVSETVAVCAKLKKMWAKNLVNAVLRNFLRQKEQLFAEIKNDKVAWFAHPKWLIQKIQQDWPLAAEAIFDANNQHPPMCLRVNLTQISREAYLAQLPTAVAMPSLVSPAGIQLSEPISISNLPGFAAGWVSVQDSAAQLAAALLAPEPGDRVLDACAAPGGKTAHLLEFQPKIVKLVAVDCDPIRLQRVIETLTRLHLSAECIVADVGETTEWWDGQLFQRILLDVPCSASGVIRRHPDIRILRRATDVAILAQKQLKLLCAAWPLLSVGGRLLYSTCSIFREENEKVIAAFLAIEKTAQEIKITAEWGVECERGRQILPGQMGMDGFYYACLKKREG